jgi:hypothetical protein
VPFSAQRTYCGLSRPEVDPIKYKATVSLLEAEEAEQLGLPLLTLKKAHTAILPCTIITSRYRK